jgi:hypothetical protein
MSDDTKNYPWPDEEPMIDDLYAEIDALKAALAKCEPRRPKYHGRSLYAVCPICATSFLYVADYINEKEHTPDCLWRKAKAGTE